MPSKLKKRFRHFYACVLAFFVIAFVASALFGQQPIKDLKPTIILISIDGFRYDYLDKYKPPMLSKLAREGVRARWMIPSFPTKTFPNHYTIATGLYPEHHGIIENNIWDFGTTFTLNKREEVSNARWWFGEPIWVTAEKQGQRAGAFFFPGTEAPIQGTLPTYWTPYDGDVANEKRVDQILSWLDLPAAERPTMYTLYFSDVDDAGHGFSPDSPQTREAVLKVDQSVTRLYEGLKKRDIAKKVNLIIVSDHGMATVDQRNAVIMDEYFDFDLAQRILWTGEIVQIFPKAGNENTIIGALKNASHTTCWRKNEIPERFHYHDNPRIAPIVCSAEEGWFMTDRGRYAARRSRPEFSRLNGAHGYDNALTSMRATFIAHGRAFKKKKLVEPFENIHVYELMCKILGLRPAKNDGDLERVRKMLR